MTRVLVTGSSARADLLQPLIDHGCIIDNPTDLLSEAALAAKLKNVEAYLLGGDEVATAGALSAASKLRVVAFLGVGYGNFVDAKAARSLGIHVTNTPGTLTQSVAEFTIGQALNAVRRLGAYSSAARTDGPEEVKRHELAALPVGIVGLGAIGTRIAEILTAGFGCKVSYWSRTRKAKEESRLGLRYLERLELFRNSKLVIVMTPGDASTTGLVGAAEVGQMPTGTILVNTARPEIVDPTALLGGIKSGRIDTAVFDKFYDESVAEQKELLSIGEERLILTRHIGSLTHEARDGMTVKAVNSILNVLRRGDDEYVVNR